MARSKNEIETELAELQGQIAVAMAHTRRQERQAERQQEHSEKRKEIIGALVKIAILSWLTLSSFLGTMWLLGCIL